MSDHGEGKPFIPLKVFRWEVIDHSLVSLKMTNLAVEMHGQIEANERRIQFENRLNMNSAAVSSRVVQMKEKCADEGAQRAYEIYCYVWKTQGYAKCGPFVRAVCARSIIPMLRARAGAIKHEFLRFATRTSLNFVVRDGRFHRATLGRTAWSDLGVLRAGTRRRVARLAERHPIRLAQHSW